MTVVGLGAWCDFVTPDEYGQRLVKGGWRATVERQSGAHAHPAPFAPQSTQEVENLVEAFKQRLSFVVHEFADLADGRRLTLRDDLGFSGWTMANRGPTPSDQWRYLTLEQLERDVRTTVLPDDDDTQEEHPWELLAGLLHIHGVEATAEELKALPYDVVFSERLRARFMADP
ncbi:MAG: hypothetical protein AB1551_06400 [Actinomycetota bacterium]